MATGDFPTTNGLYGPANAYDPSKDPVRIAAAQALARLKALGQLPITPPAPTIPNPTQGVWSESNVAQPRPTSVPQAPLGTVAKPSIFTRSSYPTLAEAMGEVRSPSSSSVQMPTPPAAPAPSLPLPLAPTDTEQAIMALNGMAPGAVQGGTSADIEGGANPTSGPANYMHWTTPEESAALAAQRAKYNVPEALAGLASANQYNNFTPGAFKPTLPSLKVYNG